jgi:hypothetical protein
LATLQPGFHLEAPMVPFVGDLSGFIDPPSASDCPDAERIAGSIAALTRHRERHRALGHGFGFSTITQASSRVPTIVRSYHKINVGPFVETVFGPRCSASARSSDSWAAPLTANITRRQLRFLGKECKRAFSAA